VQNLSLPCRASVHRFSTANTNLHRRKRFQLANTRKTLPQQPNNKLSTPPACSATNRKPLRSNVLQVHRPKKLKIAAVNQILLLYIKNKKQQKDAATGVERSTVGS
jgi:hypothetical protein